MSQLHLAGSDRHCSTRQLAPEKPPLPDSVCPPWFARLRMVNRISSWSNVAGTLRSSQWDRVLAFSRRQA